MTENEQLPLIQTNAFTDKHYFKETTLSWQHVSVETRQQSSGIIDRLRQVPVKPARVLINDVSGTARPGEILAIMGASGVGKTSLLRMLSGQDDPRTVISKGDVFINGQRTRRTQRMSGDIIGLVEQHEIFIDTMTTEEHLIFQAMLRMQRSITDDARRVRIQATVSLLSLDDCLKTTIGKISGGERKRLAFASVLLTDPSVVLIDEPTSGLDSYLAKELMIKIRMMAMEQRRTIIVVLHQPTHEMFSYINSLCLVVRGGRLAYFGRKEQALTFFTDECGLSASSLNDAIEQLAAPPAVNKNTVHLGTVAADHYGQSMHSRSIADDVAQSSQAMSERDLDVSEEWNSSFMRQLKWLFWRALMSGARDPTSGVPLLIRISVLSVLLALIYHHLLQSTEYKHNTDALLYSVLSTTVTTNVFLVITLWLPLIPICIKDSKHRMYQPLPFYVVHLSIYIPLIITFSIISSSFVYWWAGVSSRLSHFVLYSFTIALVAVTAGTIGAFLTLISSSIRDAAAITSPLILAMSISSGFFVSLTHIPAMFRIIQYISPLFYGYSIFNQLQLYDNEVMQCPFSLKK